MISQKRLWLAWPPALADGGPDLLRQDSRFGARVDGLSSHRAGAPCRVVDVGLMVLVVVEAHRLLVDMRLERL